MGLRGVLGVVALVWAGAAMAQEAVTTETIDCGVAESQADLTTCAGMDFDEADADLNDAYKAAMAQVKAVDAALPKDQQGAEAALREGQRAWITFRDQTCAAEGWMMHGGSAEPMVVFSCMARVTAARANDLWAMAEAP
jgi:uncharacterized protein YecT (DUF1311 family)